MPKGNYIVTLNIETDDILFELSPTADQDIPIEQQDLLFDVESTLEIIRILYKDDSKSWANYKDQLLKLSQVGLVGNNAQPQLAKRALEQIKIEITNNESGKIKNKYLKALGKKALLFGLPMLCVGLLFDYLFCNCTLKGYGCINIKDLTSLVILWSGAMMGVWLSFAITRTTIGFNDLTILEKDRLEPSLRLLFTGLLAIIFGLLFIKKVFVISLGGLVSSEISNDLISAFLLGVILGLNEKILGNSLTKKTSGLLDK